MGCLKRYRNIQIPSDLAAEVEDLIKQNYWGYRSLAEFVKEAIRLRLREIKIEEEGKGKEVVIVEKR
jgi:Arc/MetJ-type ribon-helix-helix transcriptional regulator